jgi:hypothetical protein
MLKARIMVMKGETYRQQEDKRKKGERKRIQQKPEKERNEWKGQLTTSTVEKDLPASLKTRVV